MVRMDEERLWFELDKIVVYESSEQWGKRGNKAKADAALTMMGHLEKPSPESCRRMFIEDGE